MLGVNQSDFMSYMSALKSNYRKGVHRMEAILSNPTHAKEFAANLGGVSVVLGVPINLPDRNSDKLLELLLGSDVADDAVETWLHQFYEFTGWDDLLSDSARCKEMANNPLIWRAAGGSKLAVGKSIATLAGLSCSAYKDIDAVVASSTAMTAIQKSPTALNAIAASSMATAKYAAGAAGLNPADYADMKAVAASSTAMAAVAASSTAMAAVAASSTAMTAVAASSTAMAAIIANATALNAVVTSSTAMAAIVAAPVAMAALWRSDTAIKALQANATAWKTFTGASSSVMGKTVAILAGLNPSSYADMTAIAASSTAMAAVAASSTAMAAVAASSTAMTAVAASSTAMAAVVNSTTACRAIESSATAIAAMNAASGFVEVTNQVCQANSSMSVALINKKAWVSQYWNTSSDTNTSQSMLIGVNVVGGGSTNIGNFSVARTRKSVNKFVSSIRIATTYGSALSYGGIRYKPLS